MAEPEARHTFSRTVEIYRQDAALSAMIMGHLLVEAMLADLIRTSEESPRPADMFFAKVGQAESLGLLSADEAAALRRFNSIRNRFAHQLDYKLTFETAFELAVVLGRAGFDFSDETIYLNRDLSADWCGVEGCVTESVTSMFELLAWRTRDRGGPDRVA